MKFPKQFMSITELSKLGLSRTDLKNYTHVKDFPCQRTKGGGKILVDTHLYSEWLKRYQLRNGILK